MSLKYQLSFSSGEIDPILHDRVTLEKFKNGLATARNIIVGKTGTLLSRFPRAHFIKAKNNGEEIKLFSPPNSYVILEWGNLYVRVYDFTTGTASLVAEVAHAYLEADLPNMHFASAGKYVYVFLKDSAMLKFLYDDVAPAFVAAASVFSIPAAPTSMTVTPTGAPTGYARDYLVTVIKNGEESLFVENTSGTYKKPLISTEDNVIDVLVDASYANLDLYREMRVYSRPNGGGAYGLLGTSTGFYSSTGLRCKFIDLGADADFTNGIQGLITKSGLEGAPLTDMLPKTGAVYQQRLLIANIAEDEEAILASRPGFQNNFNRDYPYDGDSSLKFKSGTTGKASVLRIIDNDGMIVFTDVGVFISVGTLSVANIALEKKGPWVIKEEIPPLSVPGGVFFVDKNTNEVKQLIYSQDILTYQVLEQSIFSAHLFKNKTISSWSFQDGVTPLIIVTFSDGTFATYTYNKEHEMKAWTRHDSTYPVEQVEGTAISDSSFFVTNKDGNRYIQVSLPRYVSPDVQSSNTEFDKLSPNAFMDGIKSTSNLLNDSLVGANVFQLALISGDWDDVNTLTLTCGTSALFPDPGLGAVGTILRFFDTTDKSTVDLEVTARATDNSITVQPSSEFPSAQAVNFRLYETFDTITGLDHLEGENVAILLDGYVSNSPYNDVENYTAVTVSSGSITLPNSERGAIIIVGRPIVADIRTLNVSTVEQAPVLIESLTVNKLYIRVYNTRGLYLGNKYPETESGGVDGTSVVGMEDLDVFDVPSGTDIIGNRYKEPISKRIEQTIPGGWDSNGQISIRQVDPVHFEILSIIPDIEILSRSNR